MSGDANVSEFPRPERITVPAVHYVDERGVSNIVCLLRATDGWFTLDASGGGYWDDAESLRRFADEWREDPEFEPCYESNAAHYELLADIVDEQTAADAATCCTVPAVSP